MIAAPVGRKVVVEFPEPLLAQIERAAAELATDRSKFIRCAVERYLEVIRHKQLEQELAAGYAANANLDRELCREFALVDAASASGPASGTRAKRRGGAGKGQRHPLQPSPNG